MNLLRYIGAYLMLGGLAFVLQPLQGLEQQNSDASKAGIQQAPTERDGQHDFDPLLGSWKYHLKRRLHPLTGSNTWVEFDGTGVCHKVWDGGSQLDTLEVDGPTGHIEGLTLRLYNPQSHQWRLYWANSKIGILDPPQIGEFKNGRGEFFAQDTVNGKTILIRFVWTDMTTNSPHFEQSFSDDGGKTWEVNWITNQTRVPDAHPTKRTELHPSIRHSSCASRDGADFSSVETFYVLRRKACVHGRVSSADWAARQPAGAISQAAYSIVSFLEPHGLLRNRGLAFSLVGRLGSENSAYGSIGQETLWFFESQMLKHSDTAGGVGKPKAGRVTNGVVWWSTVDTMGMKFCHWRVRGVRADGGLH
jgi:hypothetical protein